MAKQLYVSKAFAIVTVLLTVSAIGGIITMLIVYQTQIGQLNPTPRPTTPVPTTLPTGPPPNLRLPGNLVPNSYTLYLQPHLYPSLNTSDVNATEQTLVFTGNSTVFFRCVENTMSIFLHSEDLTLLGLNVTDLDAGTLLPYDRYVQYDDGSDFLEVQMSAALVKGRNYSLYVEFQGVITESFTGLYVSTYTEDGMKKFIATTNLEPTDARSVFPCFDEPALKATFDVTIVHRRSTTALGNREKLDSSIIDDEWQFTKFFTTKLMSTYLLAFSVSEFGSFSEDTPKAGLPIMTYARKEAIEAGQAVYATKMARKVLKFYEERFDIKYSLQKLDQFAVPQNYFAAMENWGLVIYQESTLLYDEKESSTMHKEWVLDVVSHELAHQWFGNLVTMEWWNDIWLNEGFAVYMSKLGVEHAEPTWNIKQLFEMISRQEALEIDVLNSSHPLSPPADDIQSKEQIGDLFSTISYSKGGAVLRMLEDVLTERVFLAGIKMYLKAFEFKNVETQDLWTYMQKALNENGGGINVAEVMDTWTKQIGYPVITINTNNGEVYQNHFTQDPSADSGRVWHVPIRVMSETSNPSLEWLKTGSPVKKDAFLSKERKWILANVNASGYYRVNYDPENWERLLDQLEKDPNAIPVMNRAQLIDDSFNLARGKLVNVTLGLNATRFLQKETACIPWESAIKNLNYFIAMFDRSVVYGPMQAYMRKLVRPLYVHFQNKTDNSTIPIDHCQQMNQMNAIWLACANELPECEIMALKMFRQWMKNETNNRINPNLRCSIYCAALAAGGDAEWEFAWRMYQRKSLDSQKEVLAGALSCTKKIWLLSRLLEYTLDPEEIGRDDALTIISGVGSNPVGHALVWNYIRTYWPHPKHHGRLTDILPCVASRFSTDLELMELIRFQQDNNATNNMVINQAIEQTQANNQWVRQNKQMVLEWFKAEVAPKEPNSTLSFYHDL